MELPEDCTGDLRRLSRAGAAGVVIGQDLRLSSALLFGVHGLATLTDPKAPPQRAIATRRASAALRHAEMESFL
jgi:hypothetical protein